MTLPDGRSFSQEDVHARMRAIFGLFSNLSDMLSERKTGDGLCVLSYVKEVHCSRTPEESHSLLSPTPEQKEKYPDLPQEPFDLSLLRREAGCIRRHLVGLDTEYLTSQCEFMKGLRNTEINFKKASKQADQWTREPIDYASSALAAEARGCRRPWGDLIPGCISIPCPNRLLELDVPTDYDTLFAASWAQEHILKRASPLPHPLDPSVEKKDYIENSKVLKGREPPDKVLLELQPFSIIKAVASKLRTKGHHSYCPEKSDSNAVRSSEANSSCAFFLPLSCSEVVAETTKPYSIFEPNHVAKGLSLSNLTTDNTEDEPVSSFEARNAMSILTRYCSQERDDEEVTKAISTLEQKLFLNKKQNL